MFKPTINERSKQILSKKVTRKDKKVKNGETYNLQFYRAVPESSRALTPTK